MGSCELVFTLFLNQIDRECNALCQHSVAPLSRFRHIPVSDLTEFDWKDCIDELSVKAPHFLEVLTKIACHSDARNKKKVTSAHNPAICMATSTILKERNKEMCGMPLVSPLLFTSRVQKQVNYRTWIPT